MKKMNSLILTLALMLSGTICQSQDSSKKKHIIPPKKFSGPAYITEKAGDFLQYAFPTLMLGIALPDECHSRAKYNDDSSTATAPFGPPTALAASLIAPLIGNYLLGYPKSRLNIIDKSSEEETNIAWACRKLRNAAAHTGNQVLKVGTTTIPMLAATEIWFKLKGKELFQT